MKFSGIQKTSLVDFPKRVASVLFTPGCNLRCPYCHNWRIVVDPKPPFLSHETALRILEGRKKFVDAVVVTGGEPTIQMELPSFLAELKERGFLVKLDTNGLNQQELEECLPHVDYVAVDVKTSLGKYERLGAKDTMSLVRTINTLRTEKVETEFRTTVVPGLVEDEDITEIGELVKGAKNFALQQFIPSDTLDKTFRSVKPYSRAKIASLAERMTKYVENVTLRA
jgi:pyruvate formate lyase activating enzyme